MRNLRYISLVFCIVFFFNSFAQKGDKENCLAIVGFFSNLTFVKNITVNLYDGSTIIDSAKANSNGDFGFMLNRNKQYSIRISAKNYYPRLIMINTALPEKVSATPLFIFEFEIGLLKEVKDVDDFYMDFPIAMIDYDTKIKAFGYRKKYTGAMQKESRKVEAQFKVRKSK